MSHRAAVSLRKAAEPFLDFLEHWLSTLPVVSWKSLLKDHGPDAAALMIVDVTNGFCREGNLSSPRVGRLIPEVVDLVRGAEASGIRNFLLPQDNHPPNSREFNVYPRHCEAGSVESNTVEELQALPAARFFRVFPKTSVNPGLDPALQAWLEDHPAVRLFVLAGDCTDICIYQLALYLEARSVIRDEECAVVVPANCVDTYDLSPETGESVPPHPGDVMHTFFLYHMYLNGIRIVAGVE